MLAKLLIFTACVAAWLQQSSPESTSATGTASVAGTIMSDEQASRPIGRAIVTLSGPPLRPSRVAITDGEGRFVFSILPPGHFTLTASKPPYLAMTFGQTEAGKGPGVPIAVEDGQQIANLTLKLTRGSVISGRILDQRGQPLRHAPITIMEYRIVNGVRTLWSLGSNWPPTDADGVYRAYGLPAGSYIVSAYAPGNYLWFPGASAGPVTPGAEATMGRSDLREVTDAEIRWAMEQLRLGSRAHDPGPTSTPPPEPPPGQTVGYGAVYYPGASDVAGAAMVTIGPGEERTGIDFSMPLKPTALVEGHVIGRDGQPARNVRLSFSSPGGGTTSWSSPDGRFSVPNLLSGQYTITAQTAEASVSAATDVSVNGQDVTGIILSLEPRITFSGRAVFDPAAVRPPNDVTNIRVALRPIPDRQPARSSPLRADGSFEIPGVVPGAYRLTATVPHSGNSDASATWSIRSAIMNGRDVSDVAFNIGREQSAPGVVITFTDRVTELSGRLLDSAGRPVPARDVIVFSTEPAYWVQESRRFPLPTRSATDGAFRFAGLPAGRYYLAAPGGLEPSNLTDATFLKHIAAGATTVTLVEGEKKVQNLTVGGV
jgi:hypothetical protein